MTRMKPTRYAQKARCVGYWTQAVNGWTLSAKYWTVRPRITNKSPKVKNTTCHPIENSGATL